MVRPQEGEGLEPRTLVFWLSCPLMLVIGLWHMVIFPDAIKTRTPALWTTGGKGVEEVLPPRPKSKVQTFDLGWHARHYEEHCAGKDAGSEVCMQTLQAAGEAVGWGGPLTPEQLAGSRDFLAQLDAQMSATDRVLGLFNFINMMWLVSVLGLVATVGPCLAYLLGPALKHLFRKAREAIIPLAVFCHEHCLFELAAYFALLLLAAQGTRYPAAQAHAGMMVSFTAGLLLVPCWAYSTALHVKARGGDQNKLIMLSNALLAAALAPLAVVHDAQLIGFFAVLALYGALGFMCASFGFGFMIGFDGKEALIRCLISSVLLVIIFVVLRIVGISSRWSHPFAPGAMCLGNVMYFLAMLILSGSFTRSHQKQKYRAFNAAMLASLTVALLVGNVFALPSMSNTASVFLVLWAMEKEFEVKFGDIGIIVLFLNFVGLYWAAHYLHTHPELVTAMFDPQGLFV